MSRTVSTALHALTFAAALALWGCSAESTPPPAPPAAGEWLARVDAAHRRADAALAAGQPEGARAALTSALDLQPPGEVLPDDARVVQQDLGFRLSQIELDQGQPEQALLRAERSLALGRRDDLFGANLLLARGRALAGLGRDVEAASSYRDALEINAKLLRRALGKTDGGTP